MAGAREDAILIKRLGTTSALQTYDGKSTGPGSTVWRVQYSDGDFGDVLEEAMEGAAAPAPAKAAAEAAAHDDEEEEPDVASEAEDTNQK